MDSFNYKNEIKRTVGLYRMSASLPLENGLILDKPQTVYETYGSLNPDKSNVILICHALTGSAHTAGEAVFPDEIVRATPLFEKLSREFSGWRNELIGPGKLFDTNKYYIVSSNILGSCYGATGPSGQDSQNNPHRMKFPQITVRDMVNFQKKLIDFLGIKKIKTAIGGSLGGMQVLEWALLFPDMIDSIIPIATAARHSDWCIGINHLQRQSIMNDPHWDKGNYSEQPKNGLSLARQIAMVSYRTDRSFNTRFKHEHKNPDDSVYSADNLYQVESYLNYQGKKLVDRFDANSYIYLSRALDLHDIARNRGSIQEVLSSIKQKSLCIGIDSDILYPAHEQRDIASIIPNALYKEIKSPDGHDAFLIEYDQLNTIIKPFLKSI